MWSFMSRNPKSMTSKTKDGIERVKKGGYAYLLESTTNDYTRQRDCNLIQIGDLLDSKGYGFGLPKNSEWTETISNAILKLQENGKIQQFYDKWWKQIDAINCEAAEKGSNAEGNSLDFENVFGIFIVLGVSLFIAALITLIEILWSRKIRITS
jgi:ionotropic kainate glutamate receptor 2